MKKSFVIFLSFVFLISALTATSYAYATIEQVSVNSNIQSNIIEIKNIDNFSNSISMAEYPIEIKATNDKLTDLITCNIRFNSNLKEDNVFVQIYSTGGDLDSMLYSKNVNKEDKISFDTSKTEHVISIECSNYIYVGSLLLYKTDTDVMYDIYMSKFQILDFNPNLDVYSTLSKSTLNAMKSINSKQSESIVLNDKEQVLYEESINDSYVYYFNIENGGLANIQFKSDNPSAVYEIVVYYNAKYYNEKASNSIIGRFIVNGEASVLPVLLPAGQKYITVTRKYFNNSSVETSRSSSSYGILVNESKWEDVSEDVSVRDTTLGDALPCVGTPPVYNELFYEQSYYCLDCTANHNVKNETNCYNYALNIAYNYKYGYYDNIYIYGLHENCGIGYDVGELAYGYNIPSMDDTMALRAVIEADASCESSADTNETGYFQAENATAYNSCPVYQYKIAFCYMPGTPELYHFYRQNPIASGETSAKWSHKLSYGSAVSTTDSDGDDIYNPYWCDRGEYTTFGRYYTVRNPAVAEG